MELKANRGTLSIVFGVLGITFLPVIGSIVAILIGRKSQDASARTGVILGWIGLVLFVLGCCLGTLGGLMSELFVEDEQDRDGIVIATPEPTLPPTISSQRGYLGVRCDDVEDGAMVTDVIADSPAEKAGLSPGDVIVQVETTDIRSCYDLAEAVRIRPGEIVEVTIRRGAKTISLNVTLGSR